MNGSESLIQPGECLLLLVDMQAGLGFGTESTPRQVLLNRPGLLFSEMLDRRTGGTVWKTRISIACIFAGKCLRQAAPLVQIDSTEASVLRSRQ